MKATEKILMVVSMVAAAGVFGICSVLVHNHDLPLWLRTTIEVLSLANVVCMTYHLMGMAKRSRKK